MTTLARKSLFVLAFVGAFTLFPQIRPEMERVQRERCAALMKSGTVADVPALERLCLDEATKMRLHLFGLEKVEAADGRAPVKLDLSPRETCGVWIVFREHGGFKGDDQDAQAHVAEALDIASVKEQSRAAGPQGIQCVTLSVKAKARMVTRDDLKSLLRWFEETAIDEDTNVIVNPLKDRISTALVAK